MRTVPFCTLGFLPSPSGHAEDFIKFADAIQALHTQHREEVSSAEMKLMTVVCSTAEVCDLYKAWLKIHAWKPGNVIVNSEVDDDTITAPTERLTQPDKEKTHFPTARFVYVSELRVHIQFFKIVFRDKSMEVK